MRGLGPTWVGLYQAGQASLLNSPKMERRERGRGEGNCGITFTYCSALYRDWHSPSEIKSSTNIAIKPCQ